MRRTLLLVLVALSVLTRTMTAAPREIVVSAAASLADVLQQLTPVFERRSGDAVAVNVGASNTLARQIGAGARVDLFISADQAQMDVVAAQIVTGTRIDLLANRLAVAVPDDRPRTMRSMRDLLDPAIHRVAIGDPAAVPAGVYARQYLEHLGVWGALQPKLVPTGSVRLALAAVERGGVDAAIVYATDVATARHARIALTVPAGDGPRIVYPAAVLRSGGNSDGARRLLAFLRGADAARVFERAGFQVVH